MSLWNELFGEKVKGIVPVPTPIPLSVSAPTLEGSDSPQQYQVIADPSIDGVSVGDILQGQSGLPYQDVTNPAVWISADIVEDNPQWFQVVT